MSANVGRNPKSLEGRPDKEHNTFRPREFFWDSVTLYVVSVIVALAAIDVLTEFIRGSNVSCFPSDNVQISDHQNDYIRDFCSAHIPNTQYFPAFIVVHAILIAIPHYLWLNHYGGNFDFFFVQASRLDRLRDEKTGEYSDNNRLILQQLTGAFATYKKNWMFIFYVVKLFVQLLFTIAGLITAAVLFTDFEGTFDCPQHFNINDTEFWPINVSAKCVFTSLRLFGTIRAADLLLLALLILSFIWSLVWCFSSHATELGSREVADFSFQTGILPKYHVPPLRTSPCLRLLHHRLSHYLYVIFSSIPVLFTKPRISTNLDFMVMKLYRTDSGLGHVFRELQVLQRVKELDDDEQGMIELHNTQQASKVMADGSLISSDDLKAELKWKIDKIWGQEGIFIQGLKLYPENTALLLPDSLRGAVMGFGARAPKNSIALYVTFGSPSIGIASALSRIFDRVGVVNFNPYYRVYDPQHAIQQRSYASNMYQITCPVDVLSSDVHVSNMFATRLKDTFWADLKVEAQKADYVVIGPVDEKIQMTTVTLFLDQLSIGNLRPQSVLLTIHPTAISGKKTDTFKTYTPPLKYFQEFHQKISLSDDDTLLWPPEEPEEQEEQDLQNTTDSFSFPLTLHCGNCQCDFDFRVYRHEAQQPPAQAAP